MGHTLTGIIVRGPRTANGALRKAKKMLAPYAHLNEDDVLHTYEPHELLPFIDNDDTLAGKTLEEINASPEHRAALAATIGSSACGDSTAGVFENGVYGYYDTAKPDARFDYYALGGTWRGFYTATTEATDYLLGEESHLSTEPLADATHRADVIRRADIDFTAMREALAHQARTEYDAYEANTRGLTAPEPLSLICARIALEHLDFANDPEHTGSNAHIYRPAHPGDLNALSSDNLRRWETHAGLYLHHLGNTEATAALHAARTAYYAHPWVRAVAATGRRMRTDVPNEVPFVAAGDRDAYVRLRQEEALSLCEILDGDNWYMRESEALSGTDGEARTGQEMAAMIEDLPPNAWAVVMDLHY